MTSKNGRHVSRETPTKTVLSSALRNAYTINIHATDGGDLHSLVARMNLTTRRYSFTALPVLQLPVDDAVHLGLGLGYVARLIENDDEMEWFTL